MDKVNECIPVNECRYIIKNRVICVYWSCYEKDGEKQKVVLTEIANIFSELLDRGRVLRNLPGYTREKPCIITDELYDIVRETCNN